MIGIGYAAITTTLTITGNTGISGDSSNFQNNVYFYSADLTSTGLRTEDTTAAQPKLNGNTMKFTVPNTSPLKNIGDKIMQKISIQNMAKKYHRNSTYHMRRSLAIARYLFPKHIEIIPCPADDNNTKRDNWTNSEEGRARAISEVKNIISCVEQGVFPDFEI